MKKILIKMFIFGVFGFILPLGTKALCTNSDIVNLKELASNINVSYDYKIENNRALFDITFSNVFGELLLQGQDGRRYYYNEYNNGQLVFTNYRHGTSYKFDVYANGGECNNTYLTSIYATTPSYNRFYGLDVCDDAREYNLCQRWVTHDLTYSEFIEDVNNYIENRDKVNIKEEDIDISIFSYVLSFISMYYIPIIIGIIVLIVIIKIIRIKKDSFGF